MNFIQTAISKIKYYKSQKVQAPPKTEIPEKNLKEPEEISPKSEEKQEEIPKNQEEKPIENSEISEENKIFN